ncbi:heat shock transcription factor 1 [Nematocida major]|uniref:heat shock transcription factor 1 n=1 Tax=Nematocida major TaxID=1912982 RepID=UPI00200765AB|nr:heat shock transcription factor 1 [Nematocida major]KAH9385560.1 heat shock transcription factor 1 [Nematocida major]
MLKFLRNLYTVVSSSEHPSIGWNEEGNGFVILDKAGFMQKTFPLLCKSDEYGTLIRQLNNYGFSKEKRLGLDEFVNSRFIRGSPHMLEHIKRKTSVSHEKSPNMAIIQDNQALLHSNMSAINEINRKLASDVFLLRKKVDQQDRTINELVRAFIRIFNKQEIKKETLQLEDNTDLNNILSDMPSARDTTEDISIDEFLNNELDQM